MKKYYRIFFILILIGILQLPLVRLNIWLNSYKDKVIEREKKFFYSTSDKLLKLFSAGFEQILCDYFWIKALTYSERDILEFSSLSTHDLHEELEHKPQSRSEKIAKFRLLEIAVTFDPKFVYAYEWGGNVFAWDGYLDLSNSLLEKGIRHNPHAWKLYYTLGFNRFYFEKKYVLAANLFEKAREVSKGRFKLNRLNAQLYLLANRFDLGIEYFKRMYDSAEDEDMKDFYQEKINYFVVERDIAALQKFVEKFKINYGRYPNSLRELVKYKIIQKIPQEPFGGEYILNLKSKEVENKPFKRMKRVIHDIGR